MMITNDRTDLDRRLQDSGPPRSCFDRRRRPERRLPTAEETEISTAEFSLYFGQRQQAVTAPANDKQEQVADILGRARERN